MATSDYEIFFYVSQTSDDPDGNALAEYFQELAMNPNKASTPIEAGGTAFLLLNVKRQSRSGYFQGVFAKIRKSDLPRIADLLGQEEDIPLEKNQGLIEKNYFLYDPEKYLFTWQYNFHGSGTHRFEKYLKTQMDKRTVLAPVLNQESTEDLMTGDTLLSKIEISFALPKNPSMYPKDPGSRYVMGLMNGLNIESISLKGSARAPGRPVSKVLHEKTKEMLRAVAELDGARVVRAFDKESNETIDLIADRISTKVTVPTDGTKRYPKPSAMYLALSKALENAHEELYEVLGGANGIS